ncbi:MAG: DUF368 domain-containing protein [Treponemataceae bacterium]|nr:DUF368 domain-containing protein [Treponemataceae bacterium]
MKAVILFFKGIVIGMANVIPGVSGGTLAVVFNIYDKFVNAITLNVKRLRENLPFLVPLLAGMAAGVLLFSKLISFLYAHFPVQTNCVFTGLILGSIPLIFGYAKKVPDGKKAGASFFVPLALCAVAGFAVLLFFSHLEGTVDRASVASSILPPLSVRLAVRIFIAGILGAVVMIVPGISGSLIMLIMGVYTIVITSIPALFSPQTFMHALLLLLPNGIGVILGLLSGAKLISFLLKRIPNHTYAVILGLLCGSAVTVFPGVKAVGSVPAGIACALCIAGGAFLAYVSSRSEKAES